MEKIKYEKDARFIKDFLLNVRRHLHQNPEVGFDVNNTLNYIYELVKEMGLKPVFFAGGIIVHIKGNTKENILLRADIDALPIKENTNLEFKSSNSFMHACGHDMHSTMLLGALKIIKKHKKRLKNSLLILFQPAEEILLGAKKMIENKIIEKYHIKYAFMIHVLPFSNDKIGQIIFSPSGTCAPSSDFFEISIKGKSSHGAMPQNGIDSTVIGCHIVLALETLINKELGLNDKCVLTICSFVSGTNNNIISSSAVLKGSFRAIDEEVRKKIKKRILNIVDGISSTFKATGSVEFTSGCPSLYNDDELRSNVKKLLDKNHSYYLDTEKFPMKFGGGSEDFAYFSRTVPSLMVSINTGESEPLHNSKVIFDEEALIYGTAYFSLLALDFKI